MKDRDRHILRGLGGVLVAGVLGLVWSGCTAEYSHPAQKMGGEHEFRGGLSEKVKIELLLSYVGDLGPEAKFVRKGQSYDATAAVRFLRGKWGLMKSQVKTAQDFVNMASAGNMGTGSVYYVLFADGRKVPSRELLSAALERIEKQNTSFAHATEGKTNEGAGN